MALVDPNTSPTYIISGWGDTENEVGPFEDDDESMAFPQPYSPLNSPYNDRENIIESVIDSIRRVKRRTSRFDAKRQRAHDYYHNRYVDTRYESWQSNKVNPRFFVTVEQFAASITSMLERSDDWTGIKSVNKRSAFMMDFIKEQIKKYLTSGKTKFHRQFYKLVKSAIKNGYAHALPIFEIDTIPQFNGDNTSGSETPNTEGFEGLSMLGFGGLTSGGVDESTKPLVPGFGFSLKY